MYEDQIIIELSEGLEMVVTYEVVPGERETAYSPPYPDEIFVLDVWLWQTNALGFQSIELTGMSDSHLIIDFNSIIQTIHEHHAKD